MAISIHPRFKEKLSAHIDVWIKGRLAGREGSWHPGIIVLVLPAQPPIPLQHVRNQAPQAGNSVDPEITSRLARQYIMAKDKSPPADGTAYDYTIKFNDSYRTDYVVRYYNPLHTAENNEPLYNYAEEIAVETHGKLNRLNYGTLQDRTVDVISMVGAGKVVFEGLSETLTPSEAAMGLNLFGAVWSIPMVIVGGLQVVESRTEAVFRGTWDTRSLAISGVANMMSGLTAYLAAGSDLMLKEYPLWAKFFTAISASTWTAAQFTEFIDSLHKMSEIYKREEDATKAIKSKDFMNACRTLCTTAGGVAFVYSVVTSLTAPASAPALASAGFIGAVIQAVGALGGVGTEVIKRKPEPPLPEGLV